MPKPQRAKPKPPPYWERNPRPVAGGVAVVGRCVTSQGISLFIQDVISPDEVAVMRAGARPSCRHCGLPYLGVRKAA